MGSGGARSRSGPAPDPTALRRDRDVGEWTVLPAEGRQGATPDWPMDDGTVREGEMWRIMWRKPQALMWERYGQDYEVALYVRRACEAEQMDAPVALSTLVRQLADSLGLTTPGMRANRWRIDRPEPEEGTGSTSAPAPGKKAAPMSARARLKALPGGSR